MITTLLLTAWLGMPLICDGVCAQGTTRATAEITLSLNLVSSHLASISIEPVGDLDTVYKLAINTLTTGVSDSKTDVVSYLVVDPFNVLHDEQLKVAMGYGINLSVDVPNELVIASIWPDTLTEEMVLVAFHKSYGDGLMLAANLD